MSSQYLSVELSDQLSRALMEVMEQFATINGLEYEPYYHDMPIWCLYRKMPDAGFIQEVQVAAFRIDGETGLYFIPQVYAWEGIGKPAASSPERTRELTVFRAVDKLAKLNESDLSALLLKLLEESWSNASSFTEADLVPITDEG